MAKYDLYIDSQIPYVGKIPAHWNTVPNKRVMHKEKRICDSYAGQDIISLTMKGAIVRDLGAGGKMPTTFDGYQFVYPGELLMCLFDIDVTPRCVGRVYNKGLTSPAYSSFVLHDNADLGYYFYYYLMLDHAKELLHLAKNLRHSLTEEQLGQLKVPLPPIDEQVAIAKYLDRETEHIDAIIAEAKASIEEYKTWKASIIYETVTKGLDPNAEMKDSGIEGMGTSPVNWKITRFLMNNYVRARLGWKGLKAEEYVDDGYPFLSAFNIVNNQLRWHNLNYITQERYDESPEIKLSVGDILLVKDGAGIGKCARIDELPEGEATVNSSLAVITPNDNIHYRYEYYYFLSPIFQNIITRLRNGMGVPHLTQESMKEIYLPLPSIEEQIEIADYLDDKIAELNGVVADKEALVADLEAYKKSLIFEVVTGKRKVV